MTYQIIVSCYREDLSWVSQIPKDIKVYVYSKDPNHNPFPNGMPANINFISLPNIGRESDTYLYHIINHYDNLADYTIFSQGDPIYHCPNFLNFLKMKEDFNDVQPLSYLYREELNIPPKSLTENENEKITKLKIFCPEISLHNLMPIKFQDNGVGWIYWNAVDFLKIKPGENVIKNFLQISGFQKVQIRNQNFPSIYNWCIGACFGVTKNKILFYEKKLYENLKHINTKHDCIGYLLERSWMLLFGLA